MCFNAVRKLKIIPQRLGRLDSLNTDRGRRKIKLAEPKLSLKRETPRVLEPMKKTVWRCFIDWTQTAATFKFNETGLNYNILQYKTALNKP